MLPRAFSIHQCILIKSTLLLSPMSLESSLWEVMTIISNSGIVPANSTGHSICESIKIPKASVHLQISQTNHLGTFAENAIMILLPLNGECSSRHQIPKEGIS